MAVAVFMVWLLVGLSMAFLIVCAGLVVLRGVSAAKTGEGSGEGSEFFPEKQSESRTS
jgi:hypothetical protein